MEQSYISAISKLAKISLRTWVTGIITCCVIVGLVFVLRACTGHSAVYKDVYVVGRDMSWSSISVVGKEKNIVAFTNELMNAISNITHIHFRWLDLNRSDLLSNLVDGYSDAVIMGVIPHSLPPETYIFSDTILATGPVLLVRKDSEISSLKDFAGNTVGMVWGSLVAYNAELQAVVNDYHLVSANYNSSTQAIEALIKDQVDGVLLDTIPAYTLAETLFVGKIKVITPPLTNQGLHLVVLKDSASEKFMEEFDAALDTLKKDGTYSSLLEKWNLIDPEHRYLMRNKN